MTTQTSSTQFRLIPLRRLTLSPLNVRKTVGEASIEQLAELIHAEGILQNLDVYECPEGEGDERTTHAVVAGGRRWRALRLLIEQGRISSDYPVPCLTVSYDRAVQISLAENSGREPMHPADEFEAFRQLIDAGQSIDDVAARFGVTPLVVERRLKLANVSPKFIALYREGEITLEHLMAFAVTDDHGRQEQVWASLKVFDRTPVMLRRALTDDEVSLSEPIARYVGIKAYEKAGGIVHRDLFAEEESDVRLDGELVRRLATAKLEKYAERLQKEGVAWVHGRPEFDYAARAAYRRVKTVFRDPTDEEQRALEAITNEREQLAGQIEEAQEDEQRLEGLEARTDELDRQEDELNARLNAPDPEQQALAGAVITIGRDGKVEIERDLLKPEDASRFAQADKARRRAAAQKGPRVHSAALVRRLTSQRTLALQATLLERPDVALIALTHRLLLKAFPIYGSGGDSAVGIELRNAEVGPDGEELAGSLAQVALRARYAQIEARLPQAPEQLFEWLLERPQVEVLSMLAFCVALAVDCVQADETPSVADELAQAAGLDMRTWWTATTESYLAHVSKARILEIVREAVSPEVAATLTDLKKGALAAAAERRLAGTGWLPPLLRNGAVSSLLTRARALTAWLVSGPFFGRGAEREDEEGRAGVPGSRPAYHAVLAVNRGPTGFRGINGRLPAKRGSPPFIPRSHRSPIDCCARRDGSTAGNPAQVESLEPAMTHHDNVSPGAVGPRTAVIAQQVEDSERMMALPRHFGQRLLAFEGAVYDFMRRFAADYDGAYWQFYELSNGGFYMAPDGGPFRISVYTNGYEGEMSADAAGITVCLFACSHLSFRYSEEDVFGDHFHLLREFAAEHAEASAIFAAID